MAIKKEALAKIAELVKVPVADLEAAIKNEQEVDVAIPEGLTVFEGDELTTLKTNEYSKGKTAGEELAVKEVKTKMGLEFTGKKVEGLVEAATKKALEEAKLTPDKKVAELTEKLNTVTATATELQTKLAEKEKEVGQVKLSTELLKNVPAGTTLEAEDVLTLMKSKGYEFEMKDGALVAVKDGKVLEDKLAKPLGVKDVITEFAKERKLIADEGAGDPPGGRGGNGSGAGATKWTKLSEVKKYFEEQGKSVNGQEFNDAIMKAKTDNPEFALDK